MNKKCIWLCVIPAVLLVCWTGCNDSNYAQKKQAMVENWNGTVLEKKIPLAEQYLERGNISQARQALQECLEIEPENPHVQFLMGRVHFMQEQYPKAKECFQKTVTGNPQQDQAWYYLGLLAVIDKDYPQAIEYYELAYKLVPGQNGYRISYADLLSITGQHDKAQEILEEGLSTHSDDPELLLALAQLKQTAGQLEEACRIYEQAQLLHGAQARILEPCGFTYIALKKWNRAAEKFERLLTLYRDHKEQYNTTLRTLAACCFYSGNYGRALACYDELSIAFREDPEIWLNMAQAALGAEDPARTIYCVNKAIRLNPSPQAYAVLGSGYYMKKQYSKALEAFSKITGDDELAGFAWFMSGRCHQQLGANIEARLAFERAEEYDPDSELISVLLKKSNQSL